jgi:hypothetical protein
MTSTSYSTCAECNRPRKPNAIFCDCGALLDYSAPTDEQPRARASEKTNGGAAATASEWPPQPPQPVEEPTATSVTPMRAKRCTECKTLNPESLLFCWSCRQPLVEDKPEPRRRWSLRRALGLEKPALAAGERTRKSRLSGNRRRALVLLGALVLVAAAVVGAAKGWTPAREHTARWYGTAREALFPRFDPVNPSNVSPPPTSKLSNARHPPAAAFDNNLSTYWQTATPKQTWDKLRVRFWPPREIDEVSIFGGDPTGSTVVPESIQMTFYRWVPRPSEQPDVCETPALWSRTNLWGERGRFCVVGIAKVLTLSDTPGEQRFSTGSQRDINQVVITIRGVHSSSKPKAKAAVTEIEFFRKY